MSISVPFIFTILTSLPWTDDFRLFCGDLGNEVNDDVLTKTFSKYPSFNMAKVSLASSTHDIDSISLYL